MAKKKSKRETESRRAAEVLRDLNSHINVGQLSDAQHAALELAISILDARAWDAEDNG